VTGDLSVTPEFGPGLTSYNLPPFTVDDIGTVTCGLPRGSAHGDLEDPLSGERTTSKALVGQARRPVCR
jgi:hypothetical protein